MATKKLTCRNCGNRLTGQQRKWCSESCRKRASRDQEKRVRFLRQTSAFRPVYQGKLVEMRIVIDSEAQYPHLYKSRNQLQNAIHSVMRSNRMAYLVATLLEEQIPGYVFKVVVTFRR